MSIAETLEGAPRFSPVRLHVERRPDGDLILSNALQPPLASETLPGRLRRWASERPDQVFLSASAPGAPGERRAVTYAEARDMVRNWSGRLLSLGLSRERPLAVMAANGVNHALIVLAAANVGIPAAVISPTYASAFAAPYGKLATIMPMIHPGLIVADAPDDVRDALAAIHDRVADRIDAQALPVQSMHDLDWLSRTASAPEQTLREHEAAVTPDTIAKLLLTSGSTGSPKPVINTQRMMVSNMQGLELVWSFLKDEPPVMVDWLPWNHTFGGNCCFNLALYFGGSFHIDDGKPLAGQIDLTLAALEALSPNVYFNVPAGYEALLPRLEADKPFAARFFSNLNFLFNAGAAMPASTRARLEAAAHEALGMAPPIIGAWGATETAPFSTVIYFETEHAANLGVPRPGVEIKLHPFAGRTELRVRGPNVMPGYWRQPEATAQAFDEEGFYCIGDAGKLVDPDRPEKGIVFDGRVAENFKLASGTWVNVGALRLALIAATRPLISDAVIAGEGRDAIGLLIFLNADACRGLSREEIVSQVRASLKAHNDAQAGSSTRILAFDILEEPASLQNDEITEKGYLNQRGILRRRADKVEALYASGERIDA